MGIQGNAELAMADVPDSSPAWDCLTEVQKTAQRAAELCQQMLAYAGRTRFNTGAVNLNGLASEMARILEVSISKKTTMRFSLAPDLPSVDADATQIRQILMNLVVNASEAMEEGSGTITISTGCMECDAAYLDSTWLNEGLPEGRYVFLSVEDTGIGMDAETQARLFDPFFSTKFQGRGLGMAAVLGIVRGHRGAIKVESAPGRGTAVRILLPAGSRAAEAEQETPAGPQWRGGGTILFVDDEPGIRTLGRRLLERIGFSVLTAADGRECLEIYRQRPEAVSCVILDLSMPVMDGAETLRELRRIRSDIRVILSSGYGDEEITRRITEEPPSGFIQKPYRLASLARIRRTVLGNPSHDAERSGVERGC
jgi:two-component system, cell cycle sensor histidine kinase and response regulator CckA